MRPKSTRYVTIQNCGAVHDQLWRQTTSHKKVSRQNSTERPTAGLRHICMSIHGVLVRRRAAGKHTSKAASCTAQSPGRRGPAFRMPVAQMQAKRKEQRQEAGNRDCRSKSSGARAARRVRLRGEESGVHTAWRAAQARPRPHAWLGCGARRRGRQAPGRGTAMTLLREVGG